MEPATWLAHLALASLALFALVFVVALVLRALRNDSIAAYRTAQFALLLAILILPLEALLATGLCDVAVESPRVAALGDLFERANPDLEVATRPAPGSVVVADVPGHGPFTADSPVDRSPAPIADDAPESVAPQSATAWFTPRNLRALAALHLAGVVAAVVVLLARARRTRAFLRRCEPVDVFALGEPFSTVLEHSRYRAFRIVASPELETPCCTGVWRPTIVLPRGDLAANDRGRVALALLHEVIHLERRDTISLLCERVFGALFWFHPAAHWLTRVLDELRELSCDAIVVARTGRSKSYARALLEYATLPSPLHTVSDATALLHWNRRRSLLRRRIEMLSSLRSKPSNSKKMTIAAVSCTSLAAIVAFQVIAGSALPAFAGEAGETLVAYCPPKVEPAPCEQPPRTDPKRKGTKDLKSPRNGTQESPEERNKRLRELIASKRSEQDPAGLTFVSNPSAVPSELPPLDTDVKNALIQTLLRDSHSTARSTAAAALAPYLREPEVKNAFLSALRDSGDARLKVTVLDELLKREALSDDARELFVGLFAMDNSEYQRIALTEALVPFANEPDARDALVESLLDEKNAPMQVDAAFALTNQAEDSTVQAAMIRVLRNGRNEIARLAVVDALAPQVGASEDVQKVFVDVLLHDDNAITRLRVADRLAEYAADPKVRRVMIDAMRGGVSTLIQSRLADGLSAHVRESDVKRAFASLLDKVSDEVVRLRLVSALADVAHANTPNAGVPRSGLVPVIGP